MSRTKWMSVRLRTKWFWVPVQLQSLEVKDLCNEKLGLKTLFIISLQHYFEENQVNFHVIIISDEMECDE